MLKFAVVLRRKEGMSRLAFRDYFTRVHEPLASKIPGLRRYVQNFAAPDEQRDPEWDAILELYFDDREAMERAWTTPEGEAATQDLDTFADLERSSWAVVDERIVRAG